MRICLFMLYFFAFSINCMCGCGNKNAADHPPENLIIVLVDALRPDHLGVYGYKRNTSPHINEFASTAMVLDNAISQSGWTAPAIAAMFTSNYPAMSSNMGIKEGDRTLAQRLRENNFQTGAFVTNPLLKRSLGYDKGFDSYNLLLNEDARPKWLRAPLLVDAALQWVGARNRNKPFFLYLHFMDVHDPYWPPPPYNREYGKKYEGPVNGIMVTYMQRMKERKPLYLSGEDLDHLIDLYDGGIAYFDEQFGRLIQGLKTAGVFQNSIIVFTADHGDEFMEHGGVTHGQSVFDELIHVPLIVSGGVKRSGSRYSGLVEMIDLAPTLMEMLDIPFDYKVTGKSFLKQLNGKRPIKEIAFSEINRVQGYMTGRWFVSARTKSEKAIYNVRTNSYLYFNLLTDPAEAHPLSREQFQEAGRLEKVLQKWRKQYGSKEERADYDTDTMNTLRSLGYVQ
ncbi:MAG: sulfatase [bacterium]